MFSGAQLMQLMERRLWGGFVTEHQPYRTSWSGWRWEKSRSHQWKLELSQVYPEEIRSNFLVARVIKRQSINYKVVCKMEMGILRSHIAWCYEKVCIYCGGWCRVEGHSSAAAAGCGVWAISSISCLHGPSTETPPENTLLTLVALYYRQWF